MRILREPGIRRLENWRKRLKPFYDSYGMVRYYPVNGETYKKGARRFMTGMGIICISGMTTCWSSTIRLPIP